MGVDAVRIRLLEAADFDAVVRIDEKILKVPRREYFQVKFEMCVQSSDYIPVSLVAEDDGKVVGFVLGVLFIGEYGISRDTATLDTIGVDPDYQREGIGMLLINEFLEHLRALDVQKVSTLVDENDSVMIGFFRENLFKPSKIINFERSL